MEKKIVFICLFITFTLMQAQDIGSLIESQPHERRMIGKEKLIDIYNNNPEAFSDTLIKVHSKERGFLRQFFVNIVTVHAIKEIVLSNCGTWQGKKELQDIIKRFYALPYFWEKGNEVFIMNTVLSFKRFREIE